MGVIYFLIPAAIFLGLVALIGFIWAQRSGQFDDLEEAKFRMLFDDSSSQAKDQKN